MRLPGYDRYYWIGVIGMLLLALAGSVAAAETLQFPTTASEIEQALQPSKSRSFGGQWRGLKDIVEDPVDYSSEVDTSSYAKFQGLPKAAALIHFDVNSDRIRPEAYPLLNQYARALKGGLADAVLVIAGHTDNMGPEVYNWNLSRRRAQAVKDYLVSHGIAVDRLIVKAYGETQPITSNETEAGRAQNRRVEFIRVGSQN
jgi:outer membrane protein OmpA-like peptidoglycan-associated protein